MTPASSTPFAGTSFHDLEARRAQLERAIEMMPDDTPVHVITGMEAALDRINDEMTEGW